MPVYWNVPAMEADGNNADILAIGDSWFWYPFPGGSLLSRLGDLADTRGLSILAEGNNGAEAVDFVEGKYKDACRRLLRLYGASARALFISAGGNDFAGLNDLRPLLRPDCSGAATPQECFNPPGQPGSVEELFGRVRESCLRLLDRARSHLPASAPIYLHTYDYAPPNGKAVFAHGQAWLLPALQAARVPLHCHEGCVRLLIDAHHAMLQGLAGQVPGPVRVVDTRGVLSPSHWANELHPRPAGFKRLAGVWHAPMRADGLAL